MFCICVRVFSIQVRLRNTLSCPKQQTQNQIQSHQSKQTHSKHLHKTIYGFSNCGLFHWQRPQLHKLRDTVEFLISLHCLRVWLSFTLSPRTSASCCNGKTQLSSRMCLRYFSVVGRSWAANTFTYDVPQPEITKLLTALGFMMRTHSSGSQTTISTMQATKWYFYFFARCFLIAPWHRQLRVECTSAAVQCSTNFLLLSTFDQVKNAQKKTQKLHDRLGFYRSYFPV